MSDPFAAMTAALFSGSLARDAQLNGEPLRVMEEKGVAIIGAYGETTGLRTVVSLPVSAGARQGDSLVVGDVVDGVFVAAESYELDVLHADDGAVAAFVVRPA